MRQDVVIVGAPRSGTNMLRDVLTSLPTVATWPCDEINLMWRHGNRDEPSDELTREMARPAVRHYMRNQFDWVSRRYDAPVVVEKTCANSLRVEFVRAVLPTAKYVFITRDGLDATASAMERWHAPLDLGYAARKVRFVPRTDLLHYGRQFALKQVRRRRGRSTEHDTEVSTWWGPKPVGYRELLSERPLDEVCALQWQACVERSMHGLEGLDEDQLLRVSYEDFVRSPVQQATRVANFVGVSGEVSKAVAGVTPSSIGKGRARLGPNSVTRLERLVGATLQRVRHG